MTEVFSIRRRLEVSCKALLWGGSTKKWVKTEIHALMFKAKVYLSLVIAENVDKCEPRCVLMPCCRCVLGLLPFMRRILSSSWPRFEMAYLK